MESGNQNRGEPSKLSQEDITQILNEMNKKCVVSNDGNDETAAVEKEKTPFEKIASNMTIMIVVLFVAVMLTYIFPPFFKFILDMSHITDKYVLYLMWNIAFSLVLLSCFFMGIFQDGNYLIVFFFLLLLFFELLAIVNYNQIMLNYKNMSPGITQGSLSNMIFGTYRSIIYFTLSALLLIFANLSGQLFSKYSHHEYVQTAQEYVKKINLKENKTAKNMFNVALALFIVVFLLFTLHK
jgi:hypothetical protein